MGRRRANDRLLRRPCLFMADGDDDEQARVGRIAVRHLSIVLYCLSQSKQEA